MKLIDKNAAFGICIMEGANKAAELIGYLPPVDAVPVTRCRDCIHHIQNATDGLVYCNVWKSVNGYGLDGFCCYGERKQE